MADTAISALPANTTPSGTAVTVIVDGGVDYKVTIPNFVKAAGVVVLSPGAQQTGTINISGAITVGTSVYGTASSSVVGPGTFGSLGKVVITDDGTNGLVTAATGGFLYLQANGGASLNYIKLDLTNNIVMGNNGAFKTGSTTIGATSGTINGPLAIAGALTGASTGAFSSVVTASQFTGSGAGLTAGTVPNASLVTAAVTSVGAAGNLSSTGGTTPTISITATPSFTSMTLATALPVSSGGTGSATQNFVDLTTAQSIGGTKTFTVAPIHSGAGITAGTVSIGVGGAQTGTLPIANGGTGAVSLAAAPYAVISPAGAQTGSLNVTGTVTAASHLAGASSYGGSAGAAVAGPITGTSLAVTGSLSGAYSFLRNKIINGGMAIDQRNSGAVVTGANVYCVDMWQTLGNQTGKFQVQQVANINPGQGSYYALRVDSLSAYTLLGTDQMGFGTSIEANNVQELYFGSALAKTLTLSFSVYSTVAGTFGGALQNYAQTRSYPFSYTIASASTWTSVSITIPGDTTGAWVNYGNGGSLFLYMALGVGSTRCGTAGSWAAGNILCATGTTAMVATNGAQMYFTAFQLETGSIATPFEARPYGQELALCQRYCYNTNPSGITNGTHGAAYAAASTLGVAVINFPTAMRVPPTLTALGVAANYIYYFASAGYACTSLPTVSNATTTSCQLTANTAAGAAGGAAGEFQANSSANSQLIFSASL